MNATFPPAGGAALCYESIQEKMPGVFGGILGEDDVFTGQSFDDARGCVIMGNGFTYPV